MAAAALCPVPPLFAFTISSEADQVVPLYFSVVTLGLAVSVLLPKSKASVCVPVIGLQLLAAPKLPPAPQELPLYSLDVENLAIMYILPS
jgi:hypothetical protein